MSQIICNDLTLGYDGSAVCKNVSFTVEAGDYLCIVGDNGSGKSTLMKSLLRLLEPIEGKITLSDGVTRKDIGYLPQRNEIQKDFPATVGEIVRSGCVTDKGFHFFMGKAQKTRAEKNMRCMKIYDLKSRPFARLSGGQQQRTLLARALCAAEKILLLDEPVSGLDASSAEDMYSAINHLNRDHGTTIIMITHDLQAVAKYASRVLYMSDTPTLYTSISDFCRDFGLVDTRGEGN